MRSWLLGFMAAYLGSFKEAEKVVDRIVWATEKPPFSVGLDDRVLTFRGEFPSMKELREFRQWNHE